MKDISYTKEYSDFIKDYYNFNFAIEDGLAVYYGKAEVHIPYREYLVPDWDTVAFDWQKSCEEIYKKYNAKWLELRVVGVKMQSGLEETAFSTFFLNLQDVTGGELFENLNKKTRNEVRRGLKSDFAINIEGIEILEELNNLYLENMSRHGTPRKSDAYFAKLFQNMNGRAVAVTARKNGILAGANILLIGEGDVRVLMNLSRKEFWPDYVNNVLYWESIRYAKNSQFSRIDFGGGLRSDFSHKHFKEGFGAREVPIYGITIGSPIMRLKKLLHRKRRNFMLSIRSK